MSKDESETILISGALADFELARRSIDHGLEPKDFKDDRAGKIWSYFLTSDAEGEALTPDALRAIARQDDLEELAQFYVKAAARWPGSRDLHARTLDRFMFDSRKRRSSSLIRRATDNLAEAQDEKEMGKAVSLLRGAADVAVEVRRHPIMTSRQVAGELTENFGKPVRRLQTGIAKLDHVLGGGLELKRVISISGKYKIGKTTLLATIGYNVAYGEGEKSPDNKAKVLFVTLERNQTDVETLNMCRSLSMNMAYLEREYKEKADQIEAYVSDPLRDSILYYHRPGAHLEEISSVIQRSVRKYGVELVMLDYYQIVGRDPSTRLVEHLMNVDQTLTRLADDLNIAIVIAAQSDVDGKPRDSKSLLHSASANFSIRRQDNHPDAWLENLASNYRKQRDAGSPSDPAMVLDEDAGPHFASV